MRKFTTLFMVCATLCALSFTACNETPEVVDTPKAEISFEQSSLTVDAAGGEFSIAYTITNGVEGVDIEAKSSADWIGGIGTDGAKLSFTVAENSVEKRRSAKIEVTYPDHEPLSINIMQEAYEGISFNIEITEETSTSCTTHIVPSKNEIIYIANMADVSYLLTNNITTAEDLFLDDHDYIMSLVKQYEVGNIAEFMYMNHFAFMGESDITWAGMMPNAEYALYAYAIQFNDTMTDFTLASEVYHKMIMVEGGKLQDIEFDVNIEVSGPDISYEFAPVNWNGKYYFDIYTEGDYMYLEEGSTPDDNYCQTVVNNWLTLINYYMSTGYAPDQLIELMCLQGADSFRETRAADTKYMMAFYAIEMVDGIPQVVSKPYLVHFKTEPVEYNDMQIDIKAENVYVRVADITITPSTNNPYTIGLVSTSNIVDKSDDEIIAWLLKTYNMSRYEGVVTSHENTLKPSTEYSILAFGYHGGIVTSKLFRYDFKTEEEGECENSVIRVDVVGPYSPRELATADPDNFWHVDMYEDYGFYMMYSEIITEKPSRDVFHFHYDTEDFYDLGEEGVIEDLTAYSYSPVEVIAGRMGVEFIMCGITMDYRGNYSELWTSEPFAFDYSPETKRPIEELLDKINSTRNASLVYEERTPRGSEGSTLLLM